jgi:hypothetical protein
MSQADMLDIQTFAVFASVIRSSFLEKTYWSIVVNSLWEVLDFRFDSLLLGHISTVERFYMY